MSKIILTLFSILTIGSLIMTYRGTGLQGVHTHSTIKQVRSSRAGAWLGSSSGSGFSSGK
ncbi:MAG: hypothetical protein U9R27_07400 [Campylobacterota bacterium]|nr:hypothetical protein [Campylobacterota bacterium]